MNGNFISKRGNAAGMTLGVEVLADGIVHLQGGGLDGEMEALLERYNFVRRLSPDNSARVSDNSISFGKDWNLQFTGDFSFVLSCADKTVIKTGDGYCPGTAPTRYSNKGYSFNWDFSPEEKFMGMGDGNRKTLLLNGQYREAQVRNISSYIPVPFFISSNGYGVFINTTRRIRFDFGKKEKSRGFFKVEKDYLDIYVITGETPFEIIAKYTSLTGRLRMPTLFSFGLTIECHELINAHELLNLAHKMREQGIPCDTLSLEPGWAEKFYDYSLEKTWSKERFPYYAWAAKSPRSFIGVLKGMGYHFALWLATDYDYTWEEERRIKKTVQSGDAAEAFFEDDTVAEIDDAHLQYPFHMDKVTKPEEAYFEHLKKFVDEGVEIFKQDANAIMLSHPDRYYGNGRLDDEMGNFHYLLYTRQMVEGYEAHTGRRATAKACSGWAGYQEFPGVWTGDIGGGEKPLASLLQGAIAGQTIGVCDMNVEDLRGIHLGSLLPWCAINSFAWYSYPAYFTGINREAFIYYLGLRMQMLPFYYSHARGSSLSGIPFLRPMPLLYPEREEAYHLVRQYMLGNELLVSAFPETITLPEGKWYDWWNDEILAGDWTAKTVKYPENRGGHLFIREGALFPLTEKSLHAMEKPVKKLNWRVFPGRENSSFLVYLDDGLTLEYRDGKYAQATLHGTPGRNSFKLHWSEIEGTEPDRISCLNNSYEILTDRKVEKALVNGSPVAVENCPASGNTVIESCKYGDQIEIFLI